VIEIIERHTVGYGLDFLEPECRWQVAGKVGVASVAIKKGFSKISISSW